MTTDQHLTDLATERVYRFLVENGGAYSRPRLIRETKCTRKAIVLGLARLLRSKSIIAESRGGAWLYYRVPDGALPKLRGAMEATL